eukprot:8905760-Heterocapsa_arctica.AAC.1
MSRDLVLKRRGPLDENRTLWTAATRLADGTWTLGNPKLEKAILDELEMENAMWSAKPSPRPITSARSAEEVDSREPRTPSLGTATATGSTT